MHDQGLPKRLRLRSRERISDLFANGARGSSHLVLARALPASGGDGSIAVAAGKKLGGAVQRNRMKRRLRAAYRMQKDRMPRGVDMVVLAKRGLLEATWPEVMRSVAKAAEQAGTDACGRPPQERNP